MKLIKRENLISTFLAEGEKGKMVEELELYELRYSDLLLLSSENASTLQLASDENIEGFQSIQRKIMQALGPSGPGLLAVTDLPQDPILHRHHLLPYARKLALAAPGDRQRLLKEHGLGSDVSLKDPNRIVSSFAMQLHYAQALESNQVKPSKEDSGLPNPIQATQRLELFSESLKIGNTFKELGFFMMDLGIRLARICDRANDGQELEQSLLQSCSAKGRLIHYHSNADTCILKRNATRNRCRPCHKTQSPHVSKNPKRLVLDEHSQAENSSNANLKEVESTQSPHVSKNPKCLVLDEHSQAKNSSNANLKEVESRENDSTLWQQWHYDYGIFTVLTAPYFIRPSYGPTGIVDSCSCELEIPSPCGNTCLQVFDSNRNSIFTVKAPAQSFIVQVGESADVLSKGKLCSTLHSVCRPNYMYDVSRETFVVFLQPAWSKTFCISDYPMENVVLNNNVPSLFGEETELGKGEHHNLIQDIHKTIPPLSSRLRDGMTFAEFSRETTTQYYGSGGLQSNR